MRHAFKPLGHIASLIGWAQFDWWTNYELPRNIILKALYSSYYPNFLNRVWQIFVIKMQRQAELTFSIVFRIFPVFQCLFLYFVNASDCMNKVRHSRRKRGTYWARKRRGAGLLSLWVGCRLSWSRLVAQIALSVDCCRNVTLQRCLCRREKFIYILCS